MRKIQETCLVLFLSIAVAAGAAPIFRVGEVVVDQADLDVDSDAPLAERRQAAAARSWELVQEDWAGKNGVAVSEEEIAAFMRRLLDEQSVGPGGGTVALSAADKEAVTAASRQMARRWTIDKALFERFGGRVVFQQAGVEPVDAWLALIDESLASGSFEILDPDYEGMFAELRAYIDADGDLLEAGESAEIYSRPWWRMDPPGEEEDAAEDEDLGGDDETGLEPALHAAASGGRLPRLRQLLDDGADPNLHADYGPTALMSAANSGRLGAMRLLVEHGAELDRVDPAGRTALSYAVARCQTAAVESLIALGADVAVEDRDGMNALLFAIQLNCTEIIPLLEAAGAATGETPFLASIRKGDAAKALALLEAGAQDLTATDKRRRTALHLAAESGRIEIVDALLAAGADPGAKDHHGVTPLHLAAMGGHLPAVEALLSASVPIDVQDDYRRTPLTAAVDQRRASVVRFLLEAGADPNVAGNGGRRALDVAKEAGHSDLVALLERAGGRQSPPPHVPTSEILGVRLAYEGPDRVALDVDYRYDEDYEEAFLGAVTLAGGRRTPHWGFRPAPLSPGKHCARVWVVINSAAPDQHTTDAIRVEMNATGEGTFVEHDHPLRKEWRRVEPTFYSPGWSSSCGDP